MREVIKRHTALRTYALIPITWDQLSIFCDSAGRPNRQLEFNPKEPWIAKIVKQVGGGTRARYFIPETLEDMQHLHDFALNFGRTIEWYWGDPAPTFNSQAIEGLGGRNVHLWPPGHHPKEDG